MNCLLKAASILLDVEPSVLISEIGHDGTEVWWQELEPPCNERGFHIQEILDCFERRGKGLVCVQPRPAAATLRGDEREVPLTTPRKRFTKYVDRYDGILIGLTANNIPHAVALKGGKQLSNLQIDFVTEFYALSQL